jgi:hypothetical protein
MMYPRTRIGYDTISVPVKLKIRDVKPYSQTNLTLCNESIGF